jgi:GntR family transcriptional regulator
VATLGSAAPFHAQIRETLLARILDGTYKSHERMPSKYSLFAAFSVRIFVPENYLEN